MTANQRPPLLHDSQSQLCISGEGQRQALLGGAGAARQDGADAEAGAHRGRDEEHQEDAAESQIGCDEAILEIFIWCCDKM